MQKVGLRLVKPNNLSSFVTHKGAEFKCKSLLLGFLENELANDVYIHSFICEEDGEAIEAELVSSVKWIDNSDKNKESYYIDFNTYEEDFILDESISKDEFLKKELCF